MKVSYGCLFGLKRVTSRPDLLVGQCQQETETSGKKVNGKDVEVEHRICGQSIKGYDINAWTRQEEHHWDPDKQTEGKDKS